jgi:two-component system sensor histidine kinase KdpD
VTRPPRRASASTPTRSRGGNARPSSAGQRLVYAFDIVAVPRPVGLSQRREAARSDRVARRVGPRVAKVACAIGAVAGTTAALRLAGADLTVASIALLVVVIAVSALGYAAGLVGAVGAAVALTYFFTPPLHSLSIDDADDIVALVAFVTASLVAGAAVARLKELREQSVLAAREAQIRFAVTDALASGAAPGEVLATLAGELVALFDLSSCRISSPSADVRARGEHDVFEQALVRSHAVTMRLGLGRPLRAGELETIQALAASLATALDRRRLDAEAREQRLRADLDRSRAGFLSAITHDLRTPLATIKTATGALLHDDSSIDEHDRLELLEAVHEESARLERLVTNVLELTRIRSGIRPEAVDVDAADLVRGAVRRVGALAAGRAIAIDIDADLPALHVDPVLLERVLANLLENALRYDHGGELMVSARRVDAGLELAVADHGPGIAERDRSRMYDEFVRFGNDPDRGGAGLGLTIVRALTVASGGDVRYEDTPGGGATFVISLPTVSDPGASAR